MAEYTGQARDTGLRIKTELAGRPTPSLMATPAILLRDVNLFYGANQALYDISMDIGERMVTACCIFALVNEGARILQEGIAQRASDIDVVYLTGYGFPAWRGGPMFFAESFGLRNVVEAMQRFAALPGADAVFWQPATLLAQCAASDRRFDAR